MLKFFLLFLLSTTSLFAGSRTEASRILNRFAGETSVTKRLDLISKIFLGLPYGDGGPLGEGAIGKIDQDPLYRFDTFDCTTFVETIMALALTRSVNEFEDELNKIRYIDGDIDFFKRKHFTDLQWIPYNIQDGYLKDITRSIAPKNILIASAEINFPGWIRSLKVTDLRLPYATPEEKEAVIQELDLIANNYVVETATVPYIAIKTLLERPALLNKIPHGSIVNFVRPNWDLTDIAGTHQNISHQGFLFRKGKTLYLRHASTSSDKRVAELPFIDYIKKFENHPTLKGVHFMGINL